MSSLAQTAACQDLLLAGCVSHLIKKWEIITQDPWVLNCIKGYTINLLSKPHQLAPPKELNFSKEETLNLSNEVQSMVEKNAISRVCKKKLEVSNHNCSRFQRRMGTKGPSSTWKSSTLCANRALQGGGHSYPQRSPKARQLDDQSRPERHLFHDTSTDKPQEVTTIQVARRNLPVQLSPFRVVVGSVSLYQDYKANCNHTQVNWPEDDHLHRRHPETQSLSWEQTAGLIFLLENLA